MTKKYSSFKEQQILQENFRKFIKEGDFSPNLEETSQGESRLGAEEASTRILAHALSRILGTQPSGMSLDGLKAALPQVLDEMGVDVDENLSFLTTIAIRAGAETYPTLEQDGKRHEFEKIEIGTYSPDGSQRTGTTQGLKLVGVRGG
jgi:hypothetical protein